MLVNYNAKYIYYEHREKKFKIIVSQRLMALPNSPIQLEDNIGRETQWGLGCSLITLIKQSIRWYSVTLTNICNAEARLGLRAPVRYLTYLGRL